MDGLRCNYVDGSKAEPCNHDAGAGGIGYWWGKSDEFFCGLSEYRAEAGWPAWYVCAYIPDHGAQVEEWGCCYPGDPACCPWAAQPNDAGLPTYPDACNGYDPAR